MLLSVLLLLAAVQESAVDPPSVVDPAAMFRFGIVVMPTRRPVYEHLDEVFELPPRLDTESVTLTNMRGVIEAEGVSLSESQVEESGLEEFRAVQPEAVSIVTPGQRPVDFEPGFGPRSVQLDEIQGFPVGPFLERAVALQGPAVVDLPWSRSASGLLVLFLGPAYSGRVVDASGSPLAGIELHVTQVGAGNGPSSLAVVGTTGEDGKWNRESDQMLVCPSTSAPKPEPVTQCVALRTHASHAWQAFPYLEGGTIFLGEPALLSVFVLNEDGEPVDESDLRLGPATVAAPGLLDLPGPVAPQPEAVVRDLGGWEIDGLPRGVYRVYARAPGHVPAAASVDLSSGHRELMLTLPRAEPFAVTVLDAAGKPAAGASTTLTLAEGDVPVGGGVTDTTGKRLIDRAPVAGPFLLRARHPKLGTAESSWEAGPREVTLTLSGVPPPPRTSGTWGALYDRLFAE